ncbi:MAG: cyclodeaminase/cyclohydrolase family protein [Actinobacteria bacterium]|nr:cyclodeaminase/cyclohydrolase family protein [Actinomycetota bacterium]
MADEPIAGAALAATAASAANALVRVARASDDADLATRAEVLRLQVVGTARVNAARYPRALAARGDEDMGIAYAQAAEPPLELARIAADLAALAEEVARRSLLGLRTDAAVAAILAAATASGAALLVGINLTAERNDPRVDEARGYAEAAAQAADRASAL